MFSQILFLFLADTLHTGLAVVYVYDALGVHFGATMIMRHVVLMLKQHRHRFIELSSGSYDR